MGSSLLTVSDYGVTSIIKGRGDIEGKENQSCYIVYPLRLTNFTQEKILVEKVAFVSHFSDYFFIAL